MAMTPDAVPNVNTPPPTIRRQPAFHDNAEEVNALANPNNETEAVNAVAPDAMDTTNTANEPDNETPPEPEDGAALGVHTVHPLQHFVPVAVKLDPKTLNPFWTDYYTKPETGKVLWPDDGKGRGFNLPINVMFLLDLSPSMTRKIGTDPSGVDALCSFLGGLGEWFENNLKGPEFEHCDVNLAIAGFSGSCAWVDGNHCDFQDYTTYDRAVKKNDNLPKAVQEFEVFNQVVNAKSRTEVDQYCSNWVSKVTKLVAEDPMERESGSGTNTEAALRFGHAAMHTILHSKGGTGKLFLCTDGASTLGTCTADGLKAVIDTQTYHGLHDHGLGPLFGHRVQTHALMMGASPNAAVLTNLLGTKGMVAYAPENRDIQSTLESFFKPTILAVRDGSCIGTLDALSIVRIEDRDGEPLSKPALSMYSQGLLSGDNFTALFGAKMPDDFYKKMYNGTYPNAEALNQMVVSVQVWVAPSLCSRVRDVTVGFGRHEKKHLNIDNVDDVINELTSWGLRPALDVNVPLCGDAWWSPAFLQHGPLRNQVPVPGKSKADVLRSHPDCGARDTKGLYAWVESKYNMMDKLNKALGEARTHADAMATASRFADEATQSGFRTLSQRCTALREASRSIQEEEDRDLEEDADNGGFPAPPRVKRARTSASHFASSTFSQTEA